MKKKVSVVMSLVLLMSITACSKSSSETTVESSVETPATSRVIESEATISIETNPIVESGETEPTEVLPLFVIPESDYPIQDFDLDIDTDNKSIKGIYDDTEVNPDGCVIELDFSYNDYGVDEVSIYSTSTAKVMAQSPIEITDTEWSETEDPFFQGPINISMVSEYRHELSVNSALTFGNYEVDSNSDLVDLIALINEYRSDGYDIYPYYCEYIYPIAEMNANVEDEYDTYTICSDSEALHKITLRSSLDGIPVGVPSDNSNSEERMRYGDYYGCYWGVDDDYTRALINHSKDMQVDFIYYNYDFELVDSSTSAVCPLEECIKNAMPSFIYKASWNQNKYLRVYGAELVYIPFSVGCTEVTDMDFDVYFVPVWALYTLTTDVDTWVNTVYVNAITGEVVSNVAYPYA